MPEAKPFRPSEFTPTRKRDSVDPAPDTEQPTFVPATDKIAGYRELNEEEIGKINVIKQIGSSLGHLVEAMQKDEAADQRWVNIAATDLQKGLMALTRAIAQPEGF